MSHSIRAVRHTPLLRSTLSQHLCLEAVCFSRDASKRLLSFKVNPLIHYPDYWTSGIFHAYSFTLLFCSVHRGGSRILLGRMSNPSERGTSRRSSAESAEGGGVSDEGAVPPPRNFFCISSIKMVSFYAFPVIFIDTVLFKKGHRNQKGECPDTVDTSPGSAPAGFIMYICRLAVRF